VCDVNFNSAMESTSEGVKVLNLTCFSGRKKDTVRITLQNEIIIISLVCFNYHPMNFSNKVISFLN
jgi:hypothetical protein